MQSAAGGVTGNLQPRKDGRMTRELRTANDLEHSTYRKKNLFSKSFQTLKIAFANSTSHVEKIVCTSHVIKLTRFLLHPLFTVAHDTTFP